MGPHVRRTSSADGASQAQGIGNGVAMSWTYRGTAPLVISSRSGRGPRILQSGGSIVPDDLGRPTNSETVDANGYVVSLDMSKCPQWIQMLADGEVVEDV